MRTPRGALGATFRLCATSPNGLLALFFGKAGRRPLTKPLGPLEQVFLPGGTFSKGPLQKNRHLRGDRAPVGVGPGLELFVEGIWQVLDRQICHGQKAYFEKVSFERKNALSIKVLSPIERLQ